MDTGAERRQIVSGIGHVYTPEEMVGKKVVVVCNLKPAKLMGVMSQGMLLAAHGEGALEVVAVNGQNISPGTTVS